MDLIIVTVSYNTRDLLASCLESALVGIQSSGLEAEIWVVDNASADGSATMVRQRFPAVQLIAHDQNLGFAAGNNLALSEMGLGRELTPRHLLFLNPDTRVQGDALGALVRFLDATPKAGAAGASLVHGDSSFQHSAFSFPGMAQILIDLLPLHPRLLATKLNGRYRQSLYRAGRPFPIDHPLGAALVVRREVLEQIGNFDERFFMYCEEIDLCRRIKNAGWDIYCVPKAQIVHLVGQSTKQFRGPMFVALWRSRLLLYEKHRSAAYCWVVRRMVRAGMWSKARRARKANRRGEIGDEELAEMLIAYEDVAAL